MKFIFRLPAWLLATTALTIPCMAQHYTAPAGERAAVKRVGAESILPGGRLITPLGRQHVTGAGPFGIAVSPNGKRIATADGGTVGSSVTVFTRSGSSLRRERFETPRDQTPEGEKSDWRSVSNGIVFDGNSRIYVSEGNSGRVRLMNANNGDLIRTYSLNQGEFRDSYSAGLALDSEQKRMYVVDQANFRLAVIDLGSGRVLHSIPVGRLPLLVALSPDKKQAFVTNMGMFEYRPIPGADPKSPLATGLPFPAFGFPSLESENGVTRQTLPGDVFVPGLGDPNAPESNSVTVVDLSDSTPKAVKWIRVGLPFGGKVKGGSSPSGVLATEDSVYVSTGHNDGITVIDRATLTASGEIPLRIPGLESLRGIIPTGMDFDPSGKRLYVAEAGINAVAVIDTVQRKVLGHLPVGWFPAAVQVRDGNLYVANAKGQGTGPSATRVEALPPGTMAGSRHGTLSVIPLKEAASIDRHTARVMANNGFIRTESAQTRIPEAIRHVVLIIKANRSFDEVFGDMERASNGPVTGAPALARFGNLGFAEQDRGGLMTRRDLKDIPITPNHRALAERFAFSDNFYCDSEGRVDGHHWAVGSYPNLLTETTVMASGRKDFRMPTSAPGRVRFPEGKSSLHPEEQLEAGALWHHLDSHGIPFRNFGEGFELAGTFQGAGRKPTGTSVLTNVPMPEPLYRGTSRDYPGYNMNIPDQYRASQFIAEIEELYRKPGRELPRLLYISLPNDHMATPRSEDGYPYRASFVADNDLALGRIVEYLSKSPWWKNMVILVTEDNARGGVDHVDSHRTVLLVASPYARRNYASHRNVSFPGLLKTAFRILGLPSLNLYDASAADLSDCFTDTPDFRSYELQGVRKELFDPELAEAPLEPEPQSP